ncbi:MAG: hypothetical protein AAGD14_02865 [Planctomycetota bacterium]
MRDRFHPEYPDDLEVIVHDGGPRLTQRRPEQVWVTVIGRNPQGVFAGRVLNQPAQLESVSEGSVIRFVVAAGGHALMTTGKYLAERPAWEVGACDRCGLDELLDAPSDLIAAIFPNVPDDAVVGTFTSFCGLCGGGQVVRLVEEPAPTRKRWWEFWR